MDMYSQKIFYESPFIYTIHMNTRTQTVSQILVIRLASSTRRQNLTEWAFTFIYTYTLIQNKNKKYHK